MVAQYEENMNLFVDKLHHELISNPKVYGSVKWWDERVVDHGLLIVYCCEYQSDQVQSAHVSDMANNIKGIVSAYF